MRGQGKYHALLKWTIKHNGKTMNKLAAIFVLLFATTTFASESISEIGEVFAYNLNLCDEREVAWNETNAEVRECRRGVQILYSLVQNFPEDTPGDHYNRAFQACNDSTSEWRKQACKIGVSNFSSHYFLNSRVVYPKN